MQKWMLNLRKTLLAGLLASFIAGAWMVVPGIPVFASADPQTTNPPTAQPAVPGNTVPGNTQAQQALAAARLEKAFQNEQKALTGQGKRLDRVADLTTRAQQIIDKLKAKGVNVQVLQTALDDFKAAIPGAAPAHNNAKDILTTHSGFDASGKVSDLKTARSTVQSAREALQEAHQIIVNAFTDLTKIIRQVRQEHKGKQTPPAPAATPAPTNS